jgi:hypothetical protein
LRGSLPNLRFLPSVLRKSIIPRRFWAPGQPRKNSCRVFPRRQETGEAATPGRRTDLYSKSMRFYQKSILYADFCIRETLGQIPLPVRCQAAFWWPDFRCRMVRQNVLKQLISHGSSMLTEQFLGTESDFSAVDRGIAARFRPLAPRCCCGKARADEGRARPMQTYRTGSGRSRGDTESQVEDFRRADPALPHRSDRQRSVAFG